jgi:hypothetical protein
MSIAAGLAVVAPAAEPPDADPLADLRALHPVAERLDDAGDLVARHERVRDPAVSALLGQHVAVAHAGVHPHHRLITTRSGNLVLLELEVAIGPLDHHHPVGLPCSVASFVGRSPDG